MDSIRHRYFFLVLTLSVLLASPFAQTGFSQTGRAQTRGFHFDYAFPSDQTGMASTLKPVPQTKTKRTTEPSWTQHLIRKEDRFFDFKTVAKGTNAEHAFMIRNRFVETVHIASVSSSCTCTTPMILNGKDTLDTNEETAIVAHLHTDRFDGVKSATITVIIDKPYYAEFQLNIRGEIRSDLSITPKNVRFDGIKEGQESARTVSVSYYGSKANWRLVDIKSDHEFVRGEIESVEARPGAVVARVKVILSKDAPRGQFNGWLHLVSNDVESRREIPLAVSGRVGTTITVTPSTVFLGFLEPGVVSPIKTATLRGSRPFRITKLLCNNPEVQIQFVPNPDAPPRVVYALPLRYTNPVEGKAAPVDGEMKALVKVETDQEGLTPTFYVQMRLTPQEKETEQKEEDSSEDNVPEPE